MKALVFTLLLLSLFVPVRAQGNWSYYVSEGKADSSKTYFLSNSFQNWGISQKDLNSNFVLKVNWFGKIPSQQLPKSLVTQLAIPNKNWDSLSVEIAVAFYDGLNGKGGMLWEKKTFKDITDTSVSWNTSPAGIDSLNMLTLVFQFYRSPGSLLETGGEIKLRGINLNGVITGVHNRTTVPDGFELHQNYPNPFNPTTTISFTLPKDGMVTLKIYDALGREVQTLVNEFKQTGRYTAEFDASRLASGIYIYKLVSGEYSAVMKMVLVK